MTNINNVDILSGPHPEAVVPCPFDETHMIRNKRVPYHLVECRRQYRGDEMVQCPFNARHWILVNQYPFHKAVCSDRYQIEQDLALEASGKGPELRASGRIERSPYSDFVPLSEDWDVDIELRDKLEKKLTLTRARSRAASSETSCNRLETTSASSILSLDLGHASTRPPRTESVVFWQESGRRSLGDGTQKEHTKGSEILARSSTQNTLGSSLTEHSSQNLSQMSPESSTTIFGDSVLSAASFASDVTSSDKIGGAHRRTSLPTRNISRLSVVSSANSISGGTRTFAPSGRGRGLSLAALAENRSAAGRSPSSPGESSHCGDASSSVASVNTLSSFRRLSIVEEARKNPFRFSGFHFDV